MFHSIYNNSYERLVHTFLASIKLQDYRIVRDCVFKMEISGDKEKRKRKSRTRYLRARRCDVCEEPTLVVTCDVRACSAVLF